MNDKIFTRRRLLSTTTAVVGGAVLAGPATRLAATAQSSTPEPGAPGAGPLGGQVKFAYATPATLNPLFSTAGADQGVERQIYGALVGMTHEIEAPDGPRRVGRHL